MKKTSFEVGTRKMGSEHGLYDLYQLRLLPDLPPAFSSVSEHQGNSVTMNQRAGDISLCIPSLGRKRGLTAGEGGRIYRGTTVL